MGKEERQHEGEEGMYDQRTNGLQFFSLVSSLLDLYRTCEARLRTLTHTHTHSHERMQRPDSCRTSSFCLPCIRLKLQPGHRRAAGEAANAAGQVFAGEPMDSSRKEGEQGDLLHAASKTAERRRLKLPSTCSSCVKCSSVEYDRPFISNA